MTDLFGQPVIGNEWNLAWGRKPRKYLGKNTTGLAKKRPAKQNAAKT